jgi:hypothetical protein
MGNKQEKLENKTVTLVWARNFSLHNLHTYTVASLGGMYLLFHHSDGVKWEN